MLQKGQPTASALQTLEKCSRKSRSHLLCTRAGLAPPPRSEQCMLLGKEMEKLTILSPLGLKDGNTRRGRSERTQLPQADSKP